MNRNLVVGLSIGLFSALLSGCSKGPDVDQRGAAVVGRAASLASFQLAPGRVQGTVTAIHGASNINLPGAVVSLRVTGGRGVVAAAPGDSAVTGVDGHYQIPGHAPGTYVICVAAPGFVAACDQAPIVIAADTQYEARNLSIQPSRGALHGRVLLAGGRPCYQTAGNFGTAVTATVTAQDGGGAPLAAPVTTNDRGEYVIGGLVAGRYVVAATCQSERGSTAVSAGTPEIGGGVSVDVRLANHAPAIDSVITYAGRLPLRHPSPGQTVQVNVSATDADGDPLHYRYSDGSPGFVSADAPIIDWTLPSVASQSFLSVEVTDGRGGVARREFTVDTSPTGDRFLGSVAGRDGKPIAGATVTVDGTVAPVDADGNFRLALPAGERHVMIVKKIGYATSARSYRGASTGTPVVLAPATRTVVDPTKRIDLVERDAAITFAPNTLVDKNGMPPAGKLNIDVHFYPRDELPGDGSARDAQQNDASLRALGAVFVEITDDNGAHYDIAPQKSAQLSFAAPQSRTPYGIPSTLALARFNETSGAWDLKGQLVMRNGRYSATVPSFSVWSMGHVAGDTACVRVKIDEWGIDRPFGLRVFVPSQSAAEFDSEMHYTVTGTDDAISHLPPNRFVFFEVTPPNVPNHPLFSFVAYSGANAAPADPVWPYATCNGAVAITSQLPASEWLTVIGGSEQGANQYYAAIGAQPTFAQWLVKNGFDANDQQNEVNLYNPNELGLGRKINCKTTVPHVGCYITKFGHPGGSPFEAFDNTVNNVNPGDTVAMESDLVNGNRVNTFLIYRPDGTLATNTVFDSSGKKYAPSVCQHCHGANDAKFVVLDAQAYRFPGAGDNSPNGLVQQQEKIRKINAQIAYTHKHAGDYYDLLLSIYPNPNGPDAPNAKAVVAPVPAAWTGHETSWNNVIKPSCRTCHMWQSKNWTFKDPHLLGFAAWEVCGGHMPQAMSPMLRLWKTTSPNLAQALADEQSVSRQCAGDDDCGYERHCDPFGICRPGCATDVNCAYHEGAIYQSLNTCVEGACRSPCPGMCDQNAKSPGVYTSCHAGGCFQPCVTKGDCLDDHSLCVDSLCQVLCKHDYDCDGGQVCRAGACLGACMSDADCPQFTACNGGACTASDFSCAGIPLPGTRPNLTITTPGNGDTVSYGGFHFIDFQATAADAEDGLDCCIVNWKSDVDGLLGYGKKLQFTFPTPGPRFITVTAVDHDGRTDIKTFSIKVVDDTPTATIVIPNANTLAYLNVPLTLSGMVMDLNDPLLGCGALHWESNQMEDTDFPTVGCYPKATFTTTGWRTISLYAIDTLGSPSPVVTYDVYVQPVPPNSPPIVSIIQPVIGQTLDNAFPATLEAVTNPGANVTSWQWTVDYGQGEVTIGTSAKFDWTPVNNVPFHCGGSSVKLRAYGTNAYGTGKQSVNVTVGYPPC